MEDDVWKTPEAEGAAVVLSAFEGASTDPMDVPRAVFEDVKAHVGAYFLANFGYLGVAFGAAVAVVLLMALCVLPGAIMENEAALAIGGVIAFIIYFGLIMALVFIATPLMMASMMRGLDAQRRGEGTIGLTTSVAFLRERAGPVIALNAMTQLLVLMGAVFFYLPAFVAMAIGSFAMPMVVFEEVSPVEALKLSWKHATTHAAWHIGVGVMLFITVIALELTIVGLFALVPVMSAWQLYAYRLSFGEAGASAALAD